MGLELIMGTTLRRKSPNSLRLLQHGLPGTAHGKGHALADRFKGAVRISVNLLRAILRGDGKAATQVARELNAFARTGRRLISSSLVPEIVMPQPARPGERKVCPAASRAAQS